MIKVITLTAEAWDIVVYNTKDENVSENNIKYAYESSILNSFLDEGWKIKDWQLMYSGSRTWTFILEK